VYINGDKHATDASTITDNRYNELGIATLWTPKRLKRMCGFLNLTPYEIASYLGVKHAKMSRVLRTGEFPLELSVSLSHIESSHLQENMLDAPPYSELILP
jgi:hypothetical protein|tara:strand:- start:20454 stop:20756 length:303 start_codon:yes stop_codon:yes gene_type:complete